MSAGCCSSGCETTTVASPRYRKVLWFALIVNLVMFAVEIAGSLASGSVALFADSVDFAGDAANYGISLAVLSMSLLWRARAAWVKGATMFGFGLFVAAQTAWGAVAGQVPEPVQMGAIALLALLANVVVALMLYAYRDGDANMRSVWLCSRNDSISNIAVALAAVGVFGTGSRWPDLLVAAIMAGLALTAGWAVMKQARREMQGERMAHAMAAD